MSNDRELSLYMAQILDQTDRREDTVNLMKHVVELDPCLSESERNLLSASYKHIISEHRNGLRILEAIAEHEEGVATQHRKDQIQVIRGKIINDLNSTCNELINMIESKLMPASNDPKATIFYRKLVADYYRYMCEANSEPERNLYVEKAKESYQSALALAKDEIKASSPAYLGLVLNYAVFTEEILGNTNEALTLAQNIYNESSPLIEDDNSDDSYSEASMILQLFRDNITAWSQKINQ